MFADPGVELDTRDDTSEEIDETRIEQWNSGLERGTHTHSVFDLEQGGKERCHIERQHLVDVRLGVWTVEQFAELFEHFADVQRLPQLRVKQFGHTTAAVDECEVPS